MFFPVEDTLPETNVAPEHRPLEMEIPFLGAMLVSGRVSYFFKDPQAVVMQTCCCSRFLS